MHTLVPGFPQSLSGVLTDYDIGVQARTLGPALHQRYYRCGIHNERHDVVQQMRRLAWSCVVIKVGNMKPVSPIDDGPGALFDGHKGRKEERR